MLIFFFFHKIHHLYIFLFFVKSYLLQRNRLSTEKQNAKDRFNLWFIYPQKKNFKKIHKKQNICLIFSKKCVIID